MSQTIINLALALSLTELLHNIVEVAGVRSKVARLKAYIQKEPYKEMPLNINTRPKAYGLTLAAFIGMLGATFGGFSLADLNAEVAFKVIAVLLTASFFVTGFLVDKYHVDIEKITRLYKK